MKELGIIGLGVMGRNLALNMGTRIEVSVYNKTTKKTEDFIEKEVGHRKIFGYGSLEELYLP